MSSPIAGIIVIVLSGWSLSTLDASGKWIMAAGVSIWVMSWIRYIGHLFLVLAIAVPYKGISIFRAKAPKGQLIRGILMLLTNLSFFTTLKYLPQAEATAINFLSPLILLAFAPWLLKEPLRISRWVAAIVGFIGVLIIIRPQSGLPPIGVVFGLITACLFAAMYITNRRIAIDDSFTTMIWGGLIGSVALSAIMPFILPSVAPVLKQLSVWNWTVLILMGFWGSLGHLLQAQAFRMAPASMLAPFVYLQIVSAAALGWLIWGDFPDLITWIGIAIICGSGITIGWYEWRTNKHIAT